MAFTFPIAAVGDIFLVTLRMTWLAQQMINTFYWRVATNPAQDLVNQVSNGMDLVLGGSNGLYLRHKALRSLLCSLDRVSIQRIAPSRMVPQEFVKNQAGDVVASVDTGNLAATISRRGSQAKRSDIGSVHIPLPQDPSVYALGSLTPAYLQKLTDLAAIIQANITTPSGTIMEPVIYHPGPEAVPNFSFVGAAFPQSTVRVMRRRTVGLGI